MKQKIKKKFFKNGDNQRKGPKEKREAVGRSRSGVHSRRKLLHKERWRSEEDTVAGKNRKGERKWKE